MTEDPGLREFFDELEEFLDESSYAWIMDANLARLRHIDPDAALITVDFVDALCDPRLYKEQGRSHRAYTAVKHAQGRLDLWDSLFDGTRDTDEESTAA